MRFVAVLLIAIPSCCLAQDALVSYPLLTQDQHASNLPQLAVGPNDLLNIVIYDSPELSGTIRISKEGMIKIPMMNEALSVAGLMPSEIERGVAQALVRQELVVKPVVRVTVVEYQSRTIVVSGAVHKPTSFQASGEITLLDAITRADGLTDDAGAEILIESRNGGDGPTLSKRISTNSLMNSPLMENNPVLHGGEQIRVLPQGKIAVIGNVKHPGLFSIRDSQDASVLRLLARSEGLAPNASAEALIFHDTTSSHEGLTSRVDVNKILAQKTPDLQLQPGDVLYIPDNRGRRIALDVLEHLLSAGAVTSSAFIYANVR